LGGIADFTAYVVPMWAHLEEYRAGEANEHDYVQTLAAALASFGQLARHAIAKCDELGDAVSADIFTEIARGTDKWLWMVQAHL
jgi:starvation-inducible DNA-binding protein